MMIKEEIEAQNKVNIIFFPSKFHYTFNLNKI